MSLPFAIPVLETDRLTLREPRESDLDGLAAFMADPARCRFMGGTGDRFVAYRSILNNIGHWVLRGYGFWSLDLRAERSFVGRVGIIRALDEPEPELVWHLFNGHDGKGYASEAVHAIRAFASDSLGLPPLVSYIDCQNAPSTALARRVGAVVERAFVEDGCDYQAWRHLAGAGVA